MVKVNHIYLLEWKKLGLLLIKIIITMREIIIMIPGENRTEPPCWKILSGLSEEFTLILAGPGHQVEIYFHLILDFF